MGASPIEVTIDSLQDAGRNIYIVGWQENGHYCLIRDEDNERMSVASAASANGLGREEATTGHYDTFREVYALRYPLMGRKEA